ncbi:MAG: InlB B-repeat-containing protein, partial [Dethiosulfatibacter sp.]|nr:InlB B-repeat-containing protein [Dethiosulfatibacter sp.]
MLCWIDYRFCNNIPIFTPGTVTQTEILPDGTAVVQISYSRNSYIVNWISEGSTHKTEQVKYGDVITKPIINPTKQGYVFASWSGFG